MKSATIKELERFIRSNFSFDISDEMSITRNLEQASKCASPQSRFCLQAFLILYHYITSQPVEAQ